jgi:hypothetical protein
MAATAKCAASIGLTRIGLLQTVLDLARLGALIVAGGALMYAVLLTRRTRHDGLSKKKPRFKARPSP